MPELKLFDDEPAQTVSAALPGADAPLAARMRPRTLDELAGHTRLLGPGSALRKAIERDEAGSLILWGPPGCGKSSLAAVIAALTSAHFVSYSAVTSGVADVRKVIEAARERRTKLSGRTILFIDEIHRWNKAQQDALLPHVEAGTVTLIGATTENPYFELIAPLLSRLRLVRMEALTSEDISALVTRALAENERGLGKLNAELLPEAMEYIVRAAGGDARAALTMLEAAVHSAPVSANAMRTVDLQQAIEGAQQRRVTYDKAGDAHYDTISAFIKSIRGSDPDSGLFWLAVMLAGGEDPMFIARRLVILASEDVGNADPLALVVASAAAHAVHLVGLPEGKLVLAQCVTYLAAAPKSNASMIALGRAEQDIAAGADVTVPPALRGSSAGVPAHLRNSYLYPHDYPDSFVKAEYTQPNARSQPYYTPTAHGAEAAMAERLRRLWEGE